MVLATKFGNERREDGSWVGINGRPEYVHRACDASLQRLGVDHYLEENVAAADVVLADDELERLAAAPPVGAAAGDRYAEMSTIDA